MFVDLKVGDLIIMTPQNHYDPLLIGEVKSDWHTDHTMALPEKLDYPIPYREVRWLSTGLTRRDFPATVAQRMQNRKAITRIDDTACEAIFKLVYHCYIWGNTSKIDVFAPQYDSNDPTSTAESSQLVKYSVALAIAFELGELDNFYSLDIVSAVDTYFKPEYILQISQSFGSPGGYIARLIGTAAAVAAAATMAYGLSDESQSAPQVRQYIAQQIDHIAAQPGAPDPQKLRALGESMRAGSSHDIRVTYGRAAKAKLGLTLHGQQSPDLTAPDRVRP